MAMRSYSKNNLIAGGFVVGAVVLAVAISTVLSDVGRRLTERDAYNVRFTIPDGAAGLKPGSPVMLGGQRIGRVTGSSFDPAEGGAPTHVVIGIRVRTGLRLLDDALPTLQTPLVGSLGSINFVSAGISGKPVSPGGTFEGTIAPPSFLAQAGYGPEQARKVANIIDEVDKAATNLNSISERASKEFDSASASLDSILGRAESVVVDFQDTRWPVWSEQVSGVLSDTKAASADLKPLTEDARAGVEDARRTIGKVESAIDDNRPQVDRIVDSIDSAAAKVDQTTVDQLNTTLVSVDQAATDLAASAQNARERLLEFLPEFRKVMANARLASDQLKLAMIEIRRNPWRLLYQPKQKELESEILYDAARSYASAVSDLRSASEALQLLSEKTSADPEQIRLMTTQLQDAFNTYKAAETRLLELLEAKKP